VLRMKRLWFLQKIM